MMMHRFMARVTLGTKSINPVFDMLFHLCMYCCTTDRSAETPHSDNLMWNIVKPRCLKASGSYVIAVLCMSLDYAADCCMLAC